MATITYDPDVGVYAYPNTAGVIPINTVLYDFDLGALSANEQLSLHVISLGATGQLRADFSNTEGANWRAGYCEQLDTLSPSSVTTITTSGNLWAIPKLARFCRIIMAVATTSGNTQLSVTTVSDSVRRLQNVGSGFLGIGGQGAHDAAITGSPVRVAGRAVTTNYTPVATGDIADFITTVHGAQIVKPYSIPEADWQYAAASGGIINTTDVVAKAAGAAGIRNYVTGLHLKNASAVSTEFVIKDGATVIWRDFLNANNVHSVSVAFPTPLKGTAATALNIACVTTGAAVFANLQGYQAP